MIRTRRRSDGLPVLWIEAVVMIVLYYSYTAIRAVADGSRRDALAVGWDLLRIQTDLHLNVELGLNHWLQGLPALAVASCYYYASLHFVVTPTVLLWLYRKHPSRYLRARWTIACTTVISLVGFFLLPTAPPRLLPGAGFIDTMASFHDWGWWGGDSSAAPRGLGGIANQFAAMPSLHCAWALWCGWNIARFARHRRVRALGILYPAATAFVVMATANHYVLDVIAGWFVLGIGAAVASVVTRPARGREQPTGQLEPASPARPIDRIGSADRSARPQPLEPQPAGAGSGVGVRPGPAPPDLGVPRGPGSGA
ncbi:phosphatase PAP2 family protein [Frankia sp. Cppng1_Ct_nod]|uniref:phosphatase PAP2 family protein n=1 Tax=Frankia sp. Cppng1_Ct_nod TaxID=2897162 RepID=UPI0020258F96|nr:phosphatase PAP2 family protein [Frankia sp. Cppng1_Ct_nod]